MKDVIPVMNPMGEIEGKIDGENMSQRRKRIVHQDVIVRGTSVRGRQIGQEVEVPRESLEARDMMVSYVVHLIATLS